MKYFFLGIVICFYSNCNFQKNVSEDEQKMFNKANEFVQFEKYDSAIYYYSEVIKKNESYAEAFAGRALVKKATGDVIGALEDANKSVFIDSTCSACFLSRGLCREQLNNLDGATEDYRKAIQLDSLNYESYHNIARIYRIQKKLNEALIFNDIAIRIADKLGVKVGMMYIGRANTYGDIKNYEKAIENHNLALSIEPTNSVYYSQRGITYYQFEKYHEAISDFSKAISLNPSFGEFYSNRALVRVKLNDLDSACIDLSKANELGFLQAKSYLEMYCKK